MKQKCMQTLSFKAEVTDWFTQKPALTRIFDVLTQAGYVPRFVGGCVRDALFHRMDDGDCHDNGGDFDIAVPCPPETTIHILQSADIHVIPTGIDFGSVMAVIDGEHYEITSLRRDVETDGRRAVVSYTTDWAVDAHRRDFTINAMSLDRDGNLYDYCDGITDAQMGMVRFVGQADLRVQEDILRILRYYRFHMLYGKNAQNSNITNPNTATPNPSLPKTGTTDAWQACQTHAPKIDQLSRERIWAEMVRILGVGDGEKLAHCLSLMQSHGVLSMILPKHAFAKNDFYALWQSLNTILDIQSAPKNTRAMMVLVALHHATSHPCDAPPRNICLKRLCTSKNDNHIWDCLQTPLDGHDTAQLYDSLDNHGCLLTHARLILSGMDEKDTIINEINNFQEKPFPLSGGDVMALGIPAGQQVGVLLKQAKHHWYQSKCTLDKNQLLSLIE